MALDAEGDAAWPISIRFWGSAGSSRGEVRVEFTLGTPEGDYRYEGLGVLAETSTGEGGAVTYRFAGSYHVVDSPGPEVAVPRRGGLVTLLGFWTDGTTLHSARFGLL